MPAIQSKEYADLRIAEAGTPEKESTQIRFGTGPVVSIWCSTRKTP